MFFNNKHFIIFYKNPDDVSLIVQLSSDRLNHLLHTAKQYKGPISAAYFIRKHEDYTMLLKAWSSEVIFKEFVSFHLVYHNPLVLEEATKADLKIDSYSIYPINYLRNVARIHAQTLFVFYIDADFVVSSSLHHDVTNGKMRKLFKAIDPKSKLVLVLPAYNTKVQGLVMHNREHMLKLIHDKTIEQIDYPSQSFVDFETWEQRNDEEFYEIVWNEIYHFEPYFIAPRSVPL